LEKWWWRRETPQGFCGYSAHLAVPPNDSDFQYNTHLRVVICYYLHVPFVRIRMGKGMGKERRKPQTLTVEQFEVFRTRLDERGNVPPPQPESYMMGEIVRGVYPQLKKLRENGYTLKMLVRVFEESGIVISANALSTYLSKLAPTREEAQPRSVRKVSPVVSSIVEGRRGQFQMKPDVTL